MSSGRRAKLGFAVVWGLLGGGALFGQTFRQGVEFQVNRATFNNQYDPSVAVEADGDFVVVWTDAILDGGKGIWGLRFNSVGTILGNHFRVNTHTPNAQHRAVVASESNGDFVVAWQSNGQVFPLNHYTIFGQRFTSAGSPVGVEFQVNTSTHYSLVPKIASDADGDFVVAWQGNAGDPNVAVSLGGSTPPAPPWAPISGTTPSPPASRATRRSPPTRTATRDRLGERPAGRPRVRNHRQAVQLGGHRAGQRVPGQLLHVEQPVRPRHRRRGRQQLHRRLAEQESGGRWHRRLGNLRPTLHLLGGQQAIEFIAVAWPGRRRHRRSAPTTTATSS